MGSQLSPGVHALQVINPLTGASSNTVELTVTTSQNASTVQPLASSLASPTSSGGRKQHNQAPVANAGSNQTITLPASANLNGTATDDGLPTGSTLVTTWSKASGPGTVTFGNVNALSTTAGFSAAGVYVLRLTASDGTLSSTADVTITVNSSNQAPVANAGSNQTITLPASANLNGTATDDGLPTGSTLTTTWSKASGQGTVTFGNVNALNTTASFSISGTYVLRLTASDGALSGNSDVTITVNPAANQPPAAAFTYSPSSPVTGSPVSFDGSSSQCSASPCSYRWTDDADGSLLGTGVTMSFTFQQVGTKYVRLTVTDAQSQTAGIEHDVVVSQAISTAPVVNAGSNQTITLPASASLGGTASSPVGNILTITWSKVSGPGTVTFSNASALNTTAGFSVPGSYVLRLTASDGVLSSTSDVTITVNPAPTADSTYYVSTTGSDSNAGTSTSPWRTIQKAANTLRAGQTVTVNAGTYNERVQITTSGSAGSLIGFQAQGTVVMQGFNVGGSYIKITGFEIANTSGTSIFDRSSGSGLYLSGSNVEFSNNYIHNTTAAGIYFAASASNATLSTNRIAYAVECGIYVSGTNNLVVANDISHTRSVSNSDADGVRFFGSGNTLRKNYIHDIMTSDSPGQSPHIDAFQTWGPATNYVFEQNIIDKDPSQQQGFTIEGVNQPVGSIVIRNNVFITRGTGYQSDVNVGDMGLVTNVTIANNTMAAVNGPVEFAIWIFKNINTAVVKNNAIYDHGNAYEPYIRVDAGASGLDIGYNSISKSNGLAPVGSPYPNDLWMVSPQFVSIASRDFHLQSTSPLIDKGATLSTVTNDMDGVLRPLGLRHDIGAYEKQ